jgi:hypothetical protein
MDIKKTERGWTSHYICGSRCMWHRNTLLEYGELKIVVSSVGNMIDYHAPGFPNVVVLDTVGHKRYYETMVFHTDQTEFHDADVTRQISVKANGGISKPWKELEAEAMHEAIVSEVCEGLLAGNQFITYRGLGECNGIE